MIGHLKLFTYSGTFKLVTVNKDTLTWKVKKKISVDLYSK